MKITCEFLAAWLGCRFQSERAGSLVEYALLLMLIVAACAAAVKVLGGNTKGLLDNAALQVTTTAP